MAENLALVSIRIHPDTLAEIDRLTTDAQLLRLDHTRRPPINRFNRSELIRLAVRAGLDVLTNHPPLKLYRMDPCQDSTTNPQPTSEGQAIA